MGLNETYKILYRVLAADPQGKWQRAAPQIREPLSKFKSALFVHAKCLQEKKQKFPLPGVQDSQQARTLLERQNFHNLSQRWKPFIKLIMSCMTTKLMKWKYIEKHGGENNCRPKERNPNSKFSVYINNSHIDSLYNAWTIGMKQKLFDCNYKGFYQSTLWFHMVTVIWAAPSQSNFATFVLYLW